ncbi:MAG: hypothetical protein WC683_15485 [bacterium]
MTSNKSNRLLMVLAAFFLAVAAFGFATEGFSKEGSSQKEAAPYVANFSYTPDSRKAPGSGGATVTVGGPVYASPTNIVQVADWRTSPQFARLTEALKGDLPEMLVARGFGVRGPFDSYDLIPYPEKKQIDFYLTPVLEISATWKDTAVKAESSGSSGKVYHGTGTIAVNGTLTIKLQEIMTRELMWTKSVPFEYSFPYDVRFPYYETGSRPFDMGLVMDDLAKGLEQQYPKAMGTLSGLLDPEEIRVVKRQAQELKGKKGY